MLMEMGSWVANNEARIKWMMPIGIIADQSGASPRTDPEALAVSNARCLLSKRRRA